MTADSFYFFVGITGKTVESDNNGLSEVAQVTNMFVKITETFFQAFHIRFLDTVKADAAMHLQALRSGNDNSELGLQSAFTAFDVIELFRSQVRAEACFRHYIIAEGHSHFGGENGVATVRYICERTTMHKSSRSFGSLYQIGMDGVFKQYGDGTGYT